MDELEYIEEEEEEENRGKQNLTAGSDALLFLPSLKRLKLIELPKLKGWSRKVEEGTSSKEDDVTANEDDHSSATCAITCARLPSFPSLSELQIKICPQLKYMPLCPSLRDLKLNSVDGKVIPQLLSIRHHSSPSTPTSSILEHVKIESCDGLLIFPGRSLTSLRSLSIQRCAALKRVELPPAHLNTLENLLVLSGNNRLELWEEEKRAVDWDSLPNLRYLHVDDHCFPSRERLPYCLRNRVALGKLLTTTTAEKLGIAVLVRQAASQFLKDIEDED